jgi:hypothetical protein
LQAWQAKKQGECRLLILLDCFYKGKTPFELISSEPCINFIVDNLAGEWNYDFRMTEYCFTDSGLIEEVLTICFGLAIIN